MVCTAVNVCECVEETKDSVGSCRFLWIAGRLSLSTPPASQGKACACKKKKKKQQDPGDPHSLFDP